jgi:hypothetical protein
MYLVLSAFPCKPTFLLATTKAYTEKYVYRKCNKTHKYQERVSFYSVLKICYKSLGYLLNNKCLNGLCMTYRLCSGLRSKGGGGVETRQHRKMCTPSGYLEGKKGGSEKKSWNSNNFKWRRFPARKIFQTAAGILK